MLRVNLKSDGERKMRPLAFNGALVRQLKRSVRASKGARARRLAPPRRPARLCCVTTCFVSIIIKSVMLLCFCVNSTVIPLINADLQVFN